MHVSPVILVLTAADIFLPLFLSVCLVCLSLLTVNRVGKQLVNVPQFMVRMDSEKHIDFSITSPYGQGRPGRVARKRAANKAAAGGGDDEESDE